MARYQSYIICTSPRSGSTLLCKLLEQTGRAGAPDSHFHDPSVLKWLKYYALSPDQFSTHTEMLAAIFDAARTQGSGNTEIFGLRIQRHSFDYFRSQLALLHPNRTRTKGKIQAAFGNTLFIHLTRQNKLDQAISYVKATQSGLWHMAPDGTELERLSAPKQPEYDANAIAKQYAQAIKDDQDWIAWFSKEQIAPFTIPYETLSNDPQKTLAKISEKLGVAFDLATDFQPPIAKLSNAQNQEWATRFRAEKNV
ncbi:MAG: sulfotransferase [Amylibacter sp.]|jgi:trehalose 2-sulfotransferase|nr:sulfotransferase [Amylibacter sp.]